MGVEGLGFKGSGFRDPPPPPPQAASHDKLCAEAGLARLTDAAAKDVAAVSFPPSFEGSGLVFRV